MSLRKTLVLACMLVAALFYIVRVELPKDEAKRSEGMPFANLRKEAVQSLEIRTPREQFSLVNLDPKPVSAAADDVASVDLDTLKKWELAGVAGSDLDRASLNALLTALMGLKLEDPLPAEDIDSDLSVYGLDEPELSISVHDTKGVSTLQFGKENQYVSKRYAKRSDAPDVYLVSSGLFTAATKGRENFRNRMPVAFVDGDLESILIEDDRGVVTKFEMKEDFQWKIVQPAAYSAGSNAISSLTRDLRALRVSKFHDGAALADFGLDRPSARILFEFKEPGSAPPLELRLSTKKAEGREQAFMALTGKSTIYQLETNPLPSVLKPLDEFREREPFRFATDQAVQLDLIPYEDMPITVLKAGATWTVNSKPGDDSFVRGLIENLANVRAEAFPTDNRDYGFKNPRLKIVVRLASAGAEKEISERVLFVGDSAAQDKEGDTRYYAAVDDLKEPFIISKATLKGIYPKEEVLVKSLPAEGAEESPGAEPEAEIDEAEEELHEH